MLVDFNCNTDGITGFVRTASETLSNVTSHVFSKEFVDALYSVGNRHYDNFSKINNKVIHMLHNMAAVLRDNPLFFLEVAGVLIISIGSQILGTRLIMTHPRFQD
ncbi:hypothetical protein [Candidatus Regiella insecticola]|uniref:Uncharacterized protein n=1 Tax=Candidatus Regiella insecticola TaxID=138073 RepID=A0A6L2ZRD0_9ENTR|nr:hypothetical protein [Candidatus Regiella insecticola]GFN46945.1 hypothetical protein RINTU1_27710 [Candidatus Regiella insecticola]